jgi:hypothetical protein
MISFSLLKPCMHRSISSESVSVFARSSAGRKYLIRSSGRESKNEILLPTQRTTGTAMLLPTAL